MNPKRLNDLFNQIRRLRLAESDMCQTRDAAFHLASFGGGMTPAARRALETGLAVCYARPFKGNGLGKLDGWEPLSGMEGQSHEILLNLRDKMYAHSDTPYRAVADHGDVAGPSYSEAWYGLETYIDFESLMELAEAQRKRFASAADGVEALLRATKPSPAWREEHASPPPAPPLLG